MVLAICDVALGYKIKLSYTKDKAGFDIKFFSPVSKASCIPFDVNAPDRGLPDPISKTLLGSTKSSSTLSLPKTLFAASLAAALPSGPPPKSSGLKNIPGLPLLMA